MAFFVFYETLLKIKLKNVEIIFLKLYTIVRNIISKYIHNVQMIIIERKNNMTKIDLDQLVTERRNEQTSNLDEMSIQEALVVMNQEDLKVPEAISFVLPEIEQVIIAVITAFKEGGRLIYMGAGTSGRLGVLDAAECVPTFGVSSEMVVGLIAGGQQAMTKAVEGAEDSTALGEKDLIELDLKQQDIVIGIAASGRTPYVIGGLDYARKIGAKTASLACNTNAEISRHADFAIEVDAGPEFLTGSTRLKSGSAQKMILNMISTISMIGIGKVFHNLMVDVQPTNAKLVERSKRIIMQATDVSYEVATDYFEQADQEVKLAIVMILTNSSKSEAQKKLAEANGFIKHTI